MKHIWRLHKNVITGYKVKKDSCRDIFEKGLKNKNW